MSDFYIASQIIYTPNYFHKNMSQKYILLNIMTSKFNWIVLEKEEILLEDIFKRRKPYFYNQW